MLVDLADVGRYQAVGVVEAPSADAAVMELCHQAVPRDELHQHLLAEELERREERDGLGRHEEGARNLL